MYTEQRARCAPAMLVVALLIALVAGCAAPPVVTTEQSTPPAEPSAFPTPPSPLPTTEARAHVPTTKLNGPLEADQQIINLKLSPDGRYAVYIVSRSSAFPSPTPNTYPPPNPDTQVTAWVYSVPVEGGTPVLLSAAVKPPVTSISTLDFSPDNQHVAFQAHSYAPMLVIASLDGQKQEVLNPDHYTYVSPFTWSLDGKSIIYGKEDGLYSRAVAGGTPTKISDVSGVFTSDKRHVVYEYREPGADLHTSTQSASETKNGIWSALLDGSAPIQLTQGLVSPNTVIYIDYPGALPFQITPDGASVVYAAPDPKTGHFALFMVPVTGGEPQQLTQPQTVADSVFSFHFSPNSKYVVFRTGSQYVVQEEHRWTGGDILGLQSVPLAGGPVVTLAHPLGPNEQIQTVQISADSRWVVYSTEMYKSGQGSNGPPALHSVPITGGVPVKLSDQQVFANGALGYAELSPDSKEVLYTVVPADAPAAGAANVPSGVYRVPIDGGSSIKIKGATTANFSPDGTFLMYADHIQTGMYSIFQMPRAGGVPVKLNGAFGPDKHVYQYVISPDSQHIVYTAAPMDGGIAELYSVPAAR